MLQNETIVVLGASSNPSRSGYLAAKFLYNKGFPLYAVANKRGRIDTLQLHDQYEEIQHAETITIYLNAERQKKYYDYILSLQPKRIIFNPGTENDELEKMAASRHIEVIRGCTIALLTAGMI